MTEIVKGDCRAILPTLAAGRFRCCVTSPPYWAQRAYLPKGHPDTALEIGRELTPAEYVRTLVEVFREVRRTLCDDGTLWINIGDKYANDAKWGGSTGGKHAKRHHGATEIGRAKTQTGLPPKSLMGLPWRLAFALQDDGWILRSEIIWSKPTAMPEGNVSDRPTRAHEHVFLFAKSESYYFDQDAVREPHQTPIGQRRNSHHRPREREGQPPQTYGESYHPLGRNLRTVWEIISDIGDGEHAAPMPRLLARRCILAGSARGDEVIDPFGGSGTVGAIGAEEGRRVMLIDLDDRAVEKAKSRTVQGGLLPLR